MYNCNFEEERQPSKEELDRFLPSMSKGTKSISLTIIQSRK
jgi:hypothetical protein